MRYRLPAALLIALLTLFGCSGSNNTTSTDRPGDAVKALAAAMEAGDAEAIRTIMPDLETKLGGDFEAHAKQLADNARKAGGVTDVTIDKEVVDGDTAEVTAILRTGNGSAETETFNLVRRDGKWVVTID